MQLQHIELDKLSVSPANMRASRKPPDVSDILPSVRARGILVPLLVRPNGEPDAFEIVAGRRRYHAALALAEEAGTAEPIPCAVIEAGDDAAALEASLIENVARLHPHEVEQWESFTRLVKEGRSVEQIAATFGLTETVVKRVLALGNLNPRIRRLYAQEKIDVASVRHLTMASPKRQKEWLAIFDEPDQFTPTGQRLKAWLLGGAAIPTSVAIFDLDSYPGMIVSDLFGGGACFGDAETFWTAQTAEIESRAQGYRDAGWSDVVILPAGTWFQPWDHEKTPKRKGGKVFVTLSNRGEVSFHEGWLTRKEVKREAANDDREVAGSKRPEVTAAIQNYVDLHRHAAVRAKLLDHPGVALRLFVAHALHGSPLFALKPEPQRAANEATAESVETCASETAFDEKRRAALALLQLDPERRTLIGGGCDPCGTTELFARMLKLGDEEILSILAIVMGEALESGSGIVDAVGVHVGTDMAEVWEADDALFDLIRDREVLTDMVADIAGRSVADANAKEKGVALKSIVRDHLAGENGRAKVERWLPRWLQFPPASYTTRGGFKTASRYAQLADLIAR